MITKLEDSNTASKTYWAILNRLLYNNKILAIYYLYLLMDYLYLLMVVLFQATAKKQIFSIAFRFNIHTYKKQ